MDATLHVASMLQFLRNYKIFFTFLYEQIKTSYVFVLRVIVNGIACDCGVCCMVWIMADHCFSKHVCYKMGLTTQCCILVCSVY